MSDYGHVRAEQTKSQGEDAEKEAADSEEQVASLPASPDPSSITATTGTDASSVLCKQRSRGHREPACCVKAAPDWPLRGPAAFAPAVINLNNPGFERAFRVKGSGSLLHGTSETNGNYLINRGPQEQSQKRRPVTVDSSKAKTSLEALKMSIKQLKWKEVCLFYFFLKFFLLYSPPKIHRDKRGELIQAWMVKRSKYNL